MRIKDFVDVYSVSRDVSPASVEQLRFAVAALDRWLQRPADLDDLTDDLLNRWINARLAAGKSRRTIRGQRGAILSLWRAANVAGLLGVVPDKVKIVRVQRKNPDAYWPAEVAALLAAAENAPGVFASGQKRSQFLRAWLLVSYYSLLRQGDVRRLRYDDIGGDGAICITQAKTGDVVVRCLYPDALEAIAAIRTDSPFVFAVSKKTVEYWFRWLKKTAAVRGCPKWLRRSGATHCEREVPGSAMSALGHRTPGLDRRSYLDARQLQTRPPRPPRIG